MVGQSTIGYAYVNKGNNFGSVGLLPGMFCLSMRMQNVLVILKPKLSGAHFFGLGQILSVCAQLPFH